MKRQVLVCIIACAFCGTAMAGDIAISTQANWWSQGAADQEMQEIADAVTSLSVEQFSDAQEAALADWVLTHTGNGRIDLLILCGKSPNSLYPAANAQPDGSIMEEFLDDGNIIINTGDWMFYVCNEGNNGADGMVNIMDLSTMTERWDDNVPVTVTAQGQLYCPSLVNFSTDRAMHMDVLENGWEEELSLALADDGVRADPGVVRNSITGGRIGIFYEVANEDDLPRGEVISEWINNWLLPIMRRMSEPSPADGAVDVPRDVVLSWRAGAGATTHDVYFGTVLEDVRDATTSDPRGVLASQGQTDATFDPDGLLEYGVTYYWRVDENTGAPDFAVTKGDVLSFTAEPYGYLVTDIVATTNMTDVDSTQGVENIINGSGLNENGEHSVDTAQMWLATSGGEEPMYVQFEFPRVYKMYSMEVWNHNFIFEAALGLGIKDVTIEYSTDGADWTTLKDVQLAQAPGLPTYAANTTVDLESAPAKFIRLIIGSNYGGGTQFGLSEIRLLRIPTEAREPAPADGETDVSVATTLSWRAGREAVSHDVYLGPEADALAMVGTTTASSYDTPLDLGTTYFWQVNEVNDAETPSNWAGEVWNFTTEASLIIEDFEGYNDDIDAGGTIWQAWVDGIDNANAGGSIVGNDQSPFAEQTIVYGGTQSMPLRYNNSGSGFSEATRTFAPAQDWSAHGITTLVLQFKGDTSAVAADRLYVKVNGTKVVYEGDLTAPIWMPFNVDLTTLGISLSNVSTLTIGVDGANDGKLYVDNIALYRQPPADPAAGPDKTLVAHWKLDETEGLAVSDSSDYGNDGVLVGMNGDEWTVGLRGGALEFAGTSTDPQYVDFGSTKSIELNDTVTMSAWVKMNEGNSGAYMGIGGRLNTSPYKGFSLVRHSSNVFRLWADDGAGVIGGFEADSDTTYTDTEWHHVCGVVDNGTSTLYVDGVAQAKQGAVDLTSSPGYAYLGKQYNSSTVHRYWNGLIDDVRIYYRALSAAEIAGL